MQQTRAQKDLKQAFYLVSELEKADDDTKKIYGGLLSPVLDSLNATAWHSPVVRTKTGNLWHKPP